MNEIQRWLYTTATAELKTLASGPDPYTLLAACGAAVLFGFVHAFMPGHGKVALVSYYLGNPARILSGIGTSTVLILTHVGSAVILVLGGFAMLRSTLGGVGRAPAFETASAVLVTAIGIWLLVRAFRHEHAHAERNSGLLALATGLVPCPLTTFIMVYAVANGIVIIGLLVTCAMAIGMIATIVLFVTCTIILRERAVRLFERTASTRQRVGRGLETASALMIVVFGIWLFATRAT